MIFRIITLSILFFILSLPTTSFAEDFLAEYYEGNPKNSNVKPASQQIKSQNHNIKHNIANKPKSFSPDRKQMEIRKVVSPAINNSQKKLPPQNTSASKVFKKPQSLGKHNVFEIKRVVPSAQKNIASNHATPSNKNFSNLTIKGPYGNAIPQKPYFSASLVTGRKPIIVIDPGHGGKDPGAIGKLGTREKDVALSYSIALMKSLQRTGKFKVIMTRYDDKFIELRDRVKIARNSGGDVLISVHADSHPDKNTRGFSVYTLSGNRASREAQDLIRKSEREEVIRGANLRGESLDVKEAIIDFAQESSKNVSDDFAATIGKHLGRRIQPLRRHQREGSLAVLTGADIPSVLIELGYLSNIGEEKLLRTEEHKQKIITSLTTAITEYFTKFNIVF
jgi:N-acetylmuramoyl-L-alanine amidase